MVCIASVLHSFIIVSEERHLSSEEEERPALRSPFSWEIFGNQIIGITSLCFYFTPFGPETQDGIVYKILFLSLCKG